MFGTRLNQVFANRWKALTWSLGILATAYCSIPSPEDTAQQGDGHPVQAAQSHKSPWSRN